MALFIPTSQASTPQNEAVKKGQLYNLDTDEYIDFQFNPENFEWSKNINWVNVSWQGDVRGGDFSFISVGPNAFELELRFLDQPGAPDIAFRVNDGLAISTPGIERANFQAIKSTIDRWAEKPDASGKPALIAVIIGPNSFEGVITQKGYRINEWFNDLYVKDAIVRLRISEWRRKVA